MPISPRQALDRLDALLVEFGEGSRQDKLAALKLLDRGALPSAAAVRRLHERLCWMRAYPDGPAVLAKVERMLKRFERRADLRKHRDALASSGIAGTSTHFRFFHGQALWLAERWPRHFVIDRRHDEPGARLACALPLLVTHTERPALVETKLDGFAALDRLRGRNTTDATFLLKRIAALPGDGYTREAFGDAIDLGFTLRPGPGTPARTTAFFAGAPCVIDSHGPVRTRPELRAELARAPRSVRRLSLSEGTALVELARAAMVLRERSLEAFSYADAGDAWLVDDGDGLAYGFVGVIPERRPTLAAMCGGLTLRNGVPIGYLEADIWGRAAALLFNTFETFRGGEAAHTFSRWLAALHAVWGCTSFSIEPYQLGRGNDEALDSGAWWFYAKLGFVPRSARLRALAAAEQARLAQRAGQRSGRRMLERLAQEHLVFDLDPGRPEPLPPQPALGLRVARELSQRFGADRDAALEACSREAMTALGMPSLAGFSGAERDAWRRWTPLTVLLALQRWPEAARSDLVALIRAKAARCEHDHVARVQRHALLREGVARLAAG